MRMKEVTQPTDGMFTAERCMDIQMHCANEVIHLITSSSDDWKITILEHGEKGGLVIRNFCELHVAELSFAVREYLNCIQTNAQWITSFSC